MGIQYRNKQEVIFANHVREFSRFYKRHKDLCGEMAGVKTFYYDDKEIKIDKRNFHLAIRRLSAYVIDNIHYVNEQDKFSELILTIRELETRFFDDEQYQEMMLKDNINIDDNILFTIKYFKYLKECFNLSSIVSKALEKSLMITTRDVRKTIDYYDFNEFYESLASYRDEVSNTISNFMFKDVVKNFKIILAYYYTYKLFMLSSNTERIERWADLLFKYIIHGETISLIIKANKSSVNSDDRRRIQEDTILIKELLSKIYIETNRELSERNILPKTNKKIYVDKTLV
jgi:hypothetical protein